MSRKKRIWLIIILAVCAELLTFFIIYFSWLGVYFSHKNDPVFAVCKDYVMDNPVIEEQIGNITGANHPTRNSKKVFNDHIEKTIYVFTETERHTIKIFLYEEEETYTPYKWKLLKSEPLRTQG